MSDEPQKPAILRTALDLLKHNWLTVVLLGVLGYVLVTDRLPAWRRGQAIVDRPAPDFVLRDLSGKEVRLADLRGKTVLLNFWATWCLPCRLEFPHLRTLNEELAGEDFVLLAITSEKEPHVRAFAERNDLNYPILLDPREESLLGYRVEQFPTLVWIDEDGNVSDVSSGLDPLLRWKVRWRVTGSPF